MILEIITPLIIGSLVVTEIILIQAMQKLIPALKKLSEQINDLNAGINQTVQYTKESAESLSHLGEFLKDGKELRITGTFGMMPLDTVIHIPRDKTFVEKVKDVFTK